MNSHQRRIAKRKSMQDRRKRIDILFEKIVPFYYASVSPVYTITLNIRFPNFTIVDHAMYDYVPDNYCIVQVLSKVADWIEQQDITLWKPDDSNNHLQRYIISNELYSLMALRWS